MKTSNFYGTVSSPKNKIFERYKGEKVMGAPLDLRSVNKRRLM